MPSHLRSDRPGDTAGTPQRAGDATRVGARPHATAPMPRTASHQQQPPLTRQAVPSPSRTGYDYSYEDERRVRPPHPSSRAGASALGTVAHVVAVICRICAIVLSVLVIAAACLSGSMRLYLVGLMNVVGRWIPRPLLGVLVVETPLGGAFRGDFALTAIILFVIDWMLCRLARRWRMR